MLVPYTVTAMAEVDVATDTNVIAGALIQLTDLNLTPVTMYDDETGSNPSTGKTTGSLGQKEIWVPPNAYLLTVAGNTVTIVVSAAIDKVLTPVASYAEALALDPDLIPVGTTIDVTDDDSAGKFIVKSGSEGSGNGYDIVSDSAWNSANKYWSRLHDVSVIKFNSIADFVLSECTSNEVEIISYYDGWSATVGGPVGGHKRFKTGGTNTAPTVGSAVSVSTIGTDDQAGYCWDAAGAEWGIAGRECSLESFGVTGGIDNSVAMQDAFYAKRNLFCDAGSDSTTVYKTSTPIKISSATKLRGMGQQIVRQGTTVNTYSAFEKTANSSVVITNPEIADQTVDCHLYLEGEWIDSVYTQKVEIEDASFQCSAASPTVTGLYCIQGGNYTLRNVDFFDYLYAVDGYDVWSCLCEKVVSNSLMSFRRGTSIKLDQCASGGTGNSGATRGGFRFDTVRDSELDVCTSDGSNDTAYYFTNCRGITVTACGMENGESTSDDFGIALHVDNSIMQVNGFYAVCNEHPTRATFSVGSSVKADFNNIECVYRASGGSFGAANYDIAVTGNGSVVTFRNTKWGGTGTGYGAPKIRFNSGVTSTIVVVYDDSQTDRRPIVFYSDGTGATLSKRGLIDYGATSTGSWVRFDDGTQMCWFTAPKTLFENTGATISTAAQGINWYRSAIYNWTYPAEFSSAASAHVMIQPRTGTSGTRLCWSRYAGGGSNATSGDIQLVGVEDFIAAGVGYTNLTDVQLFAVGRWF